MIFEKPAPIEINIGTPTDFHQNRWSEVAYQCWGMPPLASAYPDILPHRNHHPHLYRHGLGHAHSLDFSNNIYGLGLPRDTGNFPAPPGDLGYPVGNPSGDRGGNDDVTGAPATQSRQDYVGDTDRHGYGSRHLDNGQHPFSPSDIIHSGRDAAIRQAGHRDCWYDSTLGEMSLTHRGQREICNMITKDANGYTVRFPGDPSRPVHVTDQEIAADHLRNTAQWARVMEAAIIKKDPEHAAHGGSMAEAIKLLTNKHARGVENSRVSTNALERQIEGSLSHGGLVLASTPGKDHTIAEADNAAAPGGVTSRKSPVNHGHAYEVKAYDPQTHTVTLRNPHGNNRGTSIEDGRTHDGVTPGPNGELTMSIRTYQRLFKHTVTS